MAAICARASTNCACRDETLLGGSTKEGELVERVYSERGRGGGTCGVVKVVVGSVVPLVCLRGLSVYSGGWRVSMGGSLGGGYFYGGVQGGSPYAFDFFLVDDVFGQLLRVNVSFYAGPLTKSIDTSREDTSSGRSNPSSSGLIAVVCSKNLSLQGISRGGSTFIACRSTTISRQLL
jgi:hypothetical protein